MHRVAGKTALVTGAAQGIGLATARLLAREGARVVISDINDEAGAAAAAASSPICAYHHLDVTSESDWEAIAAHLTRTFGRLDILVNNAGITGFNESSGPQDPENTSLSEWRRVHAVNQDGVFLGCRSAIPLMKSQGGSIVNISSRSGLVGIPTAAAYASSKASVRNHTKTVALYCAQQGYRIRCNSVHPAAVLTPMWDPFLGTGAARDAAIRALADEVPLKMIGSPEDVAYAVLYLASDESKYITGIELTLDGGLLAGSGATPSSES